MRYPSCTKHLFNELVRFAINQAQTQEIILYSRPGWHEFPNGEIIYAYEPKDSYIPHKLLSKGVKLYKLMLPVHSPDRTIKFTCSFNNFRRYLEVDSRAF